MGQRGVEEKVEEFGGSINRRSQRQREKEREDHETKGLWIFRPFWSFVVIVRVGVFNTEEAHYAARYNTIRRLREHDDIHGLPKSS